MTPLIGRTASISAQDQFEAERRLTRFANILHLVDEEGMTRVAVAKLWRLSRSRADQIYKKALTYRARGLV